MEARLVPCILTGMQLSNFKARTKSPLQLQFSLYPCASLYMYFWWYYWSCILQNPFKNVLVAVTGEDNKQCVHSWVHLMDTTKMELRVHEIVCFESNIVLCNNSGHIDGSNEPLQKATCSVQYCGYSPNSPYCAVPNFHWLQLPCPVFGYRSCQIL